MITRSKTGGREIKHCTAFCAVNTTHRPKVWSALQNRSLRRRKQRALDRHKGRWVEDCHMSSGAQHRTTIKDSTGDTPFSLLFYGTEAVKTSRKSEWPTIRTAGYYDAKVRGVSFRLGDFVYRANDASHAEDTGKLYQSGRTLRGYGNHWEQEQIQAADMDVAVSCPARGISATSRNAIFSEVLTGSAHGARLTN
ncbi:hypothetical protein Tco_1438167 [Tanacetum coccineum]